MKQGNDGGRAGDDQTRDTRGPREASVKIDQGLVGEEEAVVSACVCESVRQDMR